MTLHWWMHWFWVTLWFAVIAGIPRPSEIVDTTTSTPIIHEDEYTNTEPAGSSRESSYVKNDDNLSVSSSPISSLPPLPTPSLLRENYRVSKSVGISPSAPVVFPEGLELKKEIKEEDYNRNIDRRVSLNDNLTILKNNNDYRVDREANDNSRDSKTTAVLRNVEESVSSIVIPSENRRDISASNNASESNPGLDSNRSLSSIRKKDSKVTWLLTGNKTSPLVNEKLISSIAEENERRRNLSNYDDDDSLAVLPLQEPIPTRFKLVLNRTKFIPSTNINNDDNDSGNDKLFNKSDDVEIEEDSRLLATAASILKGVSESPRLSRARSAFPGDYQQDEQQEQRQAETPEKNSFGNTTNSSAMDIAAVTGSCLATVVLIGTMGSLGFVMYRRRYMNPPQTLNSDKCSNPDSSGYIDDSTIRDNSEEMYSLDNDSFLNSLEAMTIQNYWTDSVKHTKL